MKKVLSQQEFNRQIVFQVSKQNKIESIGLDKITQSIPVKTVEQISLVIW